MKINWKIVRFIVLIGFIAFIYGFSNKRNESRNITKLEVLFEDETTPFITRKMVDKLLIQNDTTIKTLNKEILDLNSMENRLINHPMIRNAEIFVSIEGRLGVTIEQRKPIARVMASPSYYIDEDGLQMPLSDIFTERVPIVKGFIKKEHNALTKLLLIIKSDAFMHKNIIGLDIKTNGNIVLYVRSYDFKVLFGKPKNSKNKIQNFKAFYQKAVADKVLSSYSLINLKMDTQVVATKK